MDALRALGYALLFFAAAELAHLVLTGETLLIRGP